MNHLYKLCYHVKNYPWEAKISGYFLRIEGVNIYNTILDTTDLSTIRGGSLQYLGAPITLLNRLKSKNFDKIQVISQGASAGILKIETHRDSIGVLKATIKQTITDLSPGTFVWAIEPFNAGTNFAEIKEKLIAACRWQQMKQPTCHIPETLSGTLPCGLNWKLPAGKKGVKKGEDSELLSVSDSVHKRREYGRNQKKEFLKQYVPEIEDVSQDLETLTSPGSDLPLAGKMALIYLDGNSFGKIAANSSSDAADYEKFDLNSRTQREALLKTILTSKPLGTYLGTTLPFELLLWGGDEIEIMVPARYGWSVTQLLLKEFETWGFRKKPEDKKQSMTSGIGLVFCNHKAPITRIRSLARRLADGISKPIGKVGEFPNGYKSLVAYMVLESFDHVSDQVDEVFFQQFALSAPEKETYTDTHTGCVFDLDKMDVLTREFPSIKSSIPISILHRMAKELHAGTADRIRQFEKDKANLDVACNDSLERIREAFRPEKEQVSQAESQDESTGNREENIHSLDMVIWSHLLNLFDYITPQQSTNTDNAYTAAKGGES